MTRVEQIENDIQSLSPEELLDFRRWFQEFDDAVWDKQIEADVATGKLDEFASDPLSKHRSSSIYRIL